MKAEEQFARVEAAIDAGLKPGWKKKFVQPPWIGPARCAGCRRDPAAGLVLSEGEGDWHMKPLLRPDMNKKVILYSACLLCPSCARDDRVVERVAGLVFSPARPEAEEARRRARAEVDARTPEGWGQEMVVPPWAMSATTCRACLTTEAKDWGVCVLTRREEGRKTLLFSFAITCGSCRNDAEKVRALCDQAFGAAQEVS